MCSQSAHYFAEKTGTIVGLPASEQLVTDPGTGGAAPYRRSARTGPVREASIHTTTTIARRRC